MGRRNPEARRALPRRPGWRDISDDFWDKIARFIAEAKAKDQEGRAASSGAAEAAGRDVVCVAYGLSVEDVAP